MNTENDQVEMTTELVLDGLFSNFCSSMSIEGTATIKDIFWCGVLAAVVMVGEEDNPETMLSEIDSIIVAKNDSGEIDTSYLLDDFGDDDSVDDSDDDFDVESSEQSDDTFEEK